MHERTSRFLSAFGKIEAHFREAAGRPEHADFPTLLRQVSNTDAAARRFRKALLDFARLRNVLVHDYDHADELAIPNESSVVTLETIHRALVAPARIETLCSRSVAVCRPDEPIGDAAERMRAGSFSQMPVVDGPRVAGLLTSETIARWLAARLFGEVDILEEEPVSAVMLHQEKTRNHVFLGRQATAADALRAFDKALHQGEPLDAILITQSGKPTESLIGIVTTTDLPALIRAIGG